MQVEREYDRAGALQYPAAWGCHRATIFGCCGLHTGIDPFGRLANRS